MTYLYGDSSPSPLTGTFLDFLRDALAASVRVLVASGRLADHAARARELRRAAASELEHLRALEAAVVRGIEASHTSALESPVAQCAAVIVRSVGETVRATQAGVESEIAAKLASVELEEAAEREACFRALEGLLLRHDPPETRATLSLDQQGGASYAARLDAATPYGLAWTVDLEVAPAHLFGHVVRVEKLAPQLEIVAPEAAGWLRKEIKLRPQRLDRYFVDEVTLGDARTTIALRAEADGRGAGFDLQVERATRRLRFERAGEPSEAAGAPFETSEEDTSKLLAFHDALVAASGDLSRARRALVDVKLDGARLREVGDPSVLVDRLVAAMAPLVRELARRSLTPDELVLKRAVAGNRREELFVAKSQLVEVLAELPAPQRARFAPLGLDAPAGVEPSRQDAAMPSPPRAARGLREVPAEGDETTDELTIDVTTSEPRLVFNEPKVIVDESIREP